VLDVRDLQTHFFTDAGVVRAVDGVTFQVAAGETLGIVGESGSGKSVTAMSLMRLLDDSSRIVGGEVRFQGRDVLAMNAEELRALRGEGIAMVFQDPMTSLNPVLRIARQLAETMQAHGRYTEEQATTRAISLLGRMGITAPERAINSYPHQFSGGMRQRVMLAMGFSNEPALLIADEPTTALDVTIQAQIMDLLSDLQAEFGMGILFITHDLGVVAEQAHRVVVMYAGRLVERAETAKLFTAAAHPYSAALLRCIPDEGAGDRLAVIEGTVPTLMALPPGCRFEPRCPRAADACRSAEPPLVALGPNHAAACIRPLEPEALEPAT
jgi:oligopeptide/dipeptide ABC transporter ATP-binding protein